MLESIKIIDTYFHIEAGYNEGNMSRQQHDAFYEEIKELFTANGFRHQERRNGCPDVILGKTCLYCHPQSLSGPVEESHIACIEQLLSSAKTFRFCQTDKYEVLLDLTPDEELRHYRSLTGSVENDMLVAFSTKKKNLFKSREEILELVARKIHVPTIRTSYLSSNVSICKQFVDGVYKAMVQNGQLIENSITIGIQKIALCRTATDKE